MCKSTVTKSSRGMRDGKYKEGSGRDRVRSVWRGVQATNERRGHVYCVDWHSGVQSISIAEIQSVWSVLVLDCRRLVNAHCPLIIM